MVTLIYKDHSSAGWKLFSADTQNEITFLKTGILYNINRAAFSQISQVDQDSKGLSVKGGVYMILLKLM